MAAAKLLAAVLLLAVGCAPASAKWTCGVCYNTYQVQWGIGTLGPICMCSGGNATTTFKWAGNDDHGIFQIPNDACPSNFTGFASNDYKELAPSSTIGDFTWDLPAEEGDYWVTSQALGDCTDGIKAQFRVVSGAGRASLQLGATVVALLLGLLLTLA